jgi:chromosome segregation ATPase
MADKTPSPGRSVLGLNEPGGTAPAETPAPAQPAAPQYVYLQTPPPAPSTGGARALPWLVGALLVLSVANLILVLTAKSEFRAALSKHSDQLDLLTRRLDSSDERYAQLRGQFQVTTERLGLTQQELTRARTVAVDIQKQQQAAVAQLNDAIRQKASAEDVNKVQAEANSKIGGLSTDLAGTKKDLEATKEALSGTKGELTGAIARTHDELVALAHKTDRDYFEFSLAKKRAQQKIGTIMLELEKTDIKKNTFTVNLFADDKRIQRKDKAMNEPVYFYVQGASSALELVVNKLGKDTIAGYVSTPKGFFPTTPNILAARPGA